MPTLTSFTRYFRKLACTALALAGLTAAVQAEVVAYHDGDLFLGFRSASDPNNYLINLGPAINFAKATGPITLNVGNIAADLASNQLFGAGWYSRTDLFFSLIGANAFTIESDPGSTIYTSDDDDTPFARGSTSAQAVPTTKIGSLGSYYDGNTSTANSPAGIIQLKSSDNSYASFQPGGTAANSGGGSFATFSPSNELTPVSATAYLTRLTPTDKNAAGKTVLGTFTISSTGVLTFTPDATPAAPTVRFANASYTASEAGVKATIALMRDGDTSAAFSVQVTTTNGTGSTGAVSGTDYTAGPVTVNFASGATTASASINVVDRPNFQGSRSFTVGLANSTAGVTIVTPLSATVTITDNDPEPAGQLAFASANTTANSLNGAANPNDVLVSLTRTGGAGGAVTVPVTVTGGSFVNGADFSFTSPVAFAAGATSAQLSIHLASAKAGTINLKLGTPTGGATLGARTTTTVTIVSHGTVAFAAAAVGVAEATTDSTVMINVIRANGAEGAVTIDVTTVGGTASPGTDYVFNTTKLTWANGESGSKSVSLVIKADATPEAAKSIILGLQNPTGGVVIGTPPTITVEIAPPDVTKPTLTLTKPAANGRVTGAVATVTGIARDNQGVARVEIALNGAVVASRNPPTALTTSYPFTADVSPEQGPNTLTITAFDLQGNASMVLTRKFTFLHLRPELAGSYTGLLVAAPTASQIGYNGYAVLTVTTTGTFTGKVSLSGVAIPITGEFRNDGTAAFGTLRTPTFALTKKVGRDTVQLGNLDLAIGTAGEQEITGKIANGIGTLSTLGHADRAIYSKTAPVPTNIYDGTATGEKGVYTALLPPDAAPNNGLTADKFPQGFGSAKVTVTSLGAVKIIGKLADGTALSYTGALNQFNQVPVFVPLYTNTGLITGTTTFGTAQSTNDASAPNLRWFKPAGLARQVYYPNGWPNGITVDLMAAKYFVPNARAATLITALGAGLTPAANPQTANIMITLEDGGLMAPFPSSQASISSASRVTVLPPVNPTGLTVTLTPTTGALSGRFTHPVSKKVLTYTGFAYQKTNSAGGYFLYTPLSTAPAGSTAQSGSVTVEKKP